MARGQTNKLYRTFIKGLITEAGFLTYPEDASTDELNTVLKRKGSRSRRLGLDYEPNSVGSTIATATETDVTSEYHWHSVASISTMNFLCVQINTKVYFFDTAGDPIAGSKKSFTVDLDTYKVSPFITADVAVNRCQMTGGKGFLFIAHPCLNPLVIEYTAATDSITVVPITIQMRDFDGINDGLANDEEPTSLTKEHYYNLQNQGWVNPGINGVIQGAGTTNPFTTPSPPASSGTNVYYDPYGGGQRTYIP